MWLLEWASLPARKKEEAIMRGDLWRKSFIAATVLLMCSRWDIREARGVSCPNGVCPGGGTNDPPPCETCPCPAGGGPGGGGGGGGGGAGAGGSSGAHNPMDHGNHGGGAGRTGPGGAASDPCCDTNCCSGSPIFWISEPQLSVRIEDEPLGWTPARGPRVSFHLSYRQGQPVSGDPTIFGVGTNWSCSFRTYIYQYPGDTTKAYLHKAGAAWVDYSFGSAQRRDGSIATTNGAGGYKLEHTDGSVDTYNTFFTTSDGDVLVFLTTKADAAGNTNTYTYSTNAGIFRLDTVTDSDNHVTHVYYENTSFPAQITKVVDPYSRTNLLKYNGAGSSANKDQP